MFGRVSTLNEIAQEENDDDQTNASLTAETQSVSPEEQAQTATRVKAAGSVYTRIQSIKFLFGDDWLALVSQFVDRAANLFCVSHLRFEREILL